MRFREYYCELKKNGCYWVFLQKPWLHFVD